MKSIKKRCIASKRCVVGSGKSTLVRKTQIPLFLSALFAGDLALSVQRVEITCESKRYIINTSLEPSESCTFEITTIRSGVPNFRIINLRRSDLPLEFFHAQSLGDSMTVLATCNDGTRASATATVNRSCLKGSFRDTVTVPEVVNAPAGTRRGDPDVIRSLRTARESALSTVQRECGAFTRACRLAQDRVAEIEVQLSIEEGKLIPELINGG